MGIIAGGVLGYEGELRAGEDLEQLFMDVILSLIHILRTGVKNGLTMLILSGMRIVSARVG